jgi:hypothetical protein
MPMPSTVRGWVPLLAAVIGVALTGFVGGASWGVSQVHGLDKRLVTLETDKVYTANFEGEMSQFKGHVESCLTDIRNQLANMDRDFRVFAARMDQAHHEPRTP